MTTTNSKHEARNTKQNQIFKFLNDLRIRVLNLFRISNFEFLIFVLVLIFFQIHTDQKIFAESSKPRLGFWVPCEGSQQVLASKDRIIQLLETSKKMGVTDIFLQIYRRNNSWYRSQLASDAPFQAILQNQKMDTLAFVIQEAHKRGIKIHGWFNVFWIGKDLNVPIIKKFGREIITKDQKGTSMVDFPNYTIPGELGKWFSYGEDGYWLEPGDSRVQNYLLALFQEALLNYPNLDGIHLDFVRYPFASPYLPGSYYAFTRGIEFGYGAKSIERFQKKYRLNPIKMARTVQNHLLWDQWRRDQITNFLIQLRKIISKTSPKLIFSCAVLPWPERSYFCSFQDWTRWIQEGPIDFVVTMNYTIDQHLVMFLSRMSLGAGKPGKVWIGLGPYLFEKDGVGFSKQVQNTFSIAPPGIVFFSYDGLLDQKEVMQSLQKTLQSKNHS